MNRYLRVLNGVRPTMRASLAWLLAFSLAACSTTSEYRTTAIPSPAFETATSSATMPAASDGSAANAATKPDLLATQLARRGEFRKIQRRWSWKPYTAIALVASGVVAASMIWIGFLRNNRALGMTGVGLSLAIPIGGTIAFLVKQETPWWRENPSQWTPAKGETMHVQVVDSNLQALLQQDFSVPDHGIVVVDLQQALCAQQAWRQGQALEISWSLREAQADTVASTAALQGALLCGAQVGSVAHAKPASTNASTKENLQ